LNPIALSAQGLVKSYARTVILKGIDFQIAREERCAVIGPNGAGKTTLFNVLSGRTPVTSGRVELHSRSIGGLSAHEINRLGLARSFQVTNLFGQMSVYDNLQCAALWSKGYGLSWWRSIRTLSAVNARVEELLVQLGLEGRAAVKAGLLSYAEQRSLEIGITVAGSADVILLDEPTAGMSRFESDAAIALIRKLTVGKTLVMIEHDMTVVFGIADRIIVLANGGVVASGTPTQIRENPQVQEAYLGTTLSTNQFGQLLQ
jgi:branched-chain amino acid transport system ATP-binding protein